MNGKYAPLQEHIRKLDERGCREWRTTFTEIEKILGDSLPPSARKYQAWWAKDRTHSHSQAWTALGWETHDLDIAKESVSFRRKN